jgi:hypothetical protein
VKHRTQLSVFETRGGCIDFGSLRSTVTCVGEIDRRTEIVAAEVVNTDAS